MDIGEATMAAVSKSGTKALEALFPGPRRVIFCALFAEPERWWSLPDLAGRAGIQPGSLRPHLKHLRDAGVLREKTEARRAWFQPADDSPVFYELRGIVQKLCVAADGSETILVVEDQPATAQITRILLESWGYRVFEAHGAEEAFDIFERHQEEVRLLLTDLLMPGIGGDELADTLRHRQPGLRVVFMSGAADEQFTGGDAAFLSKPFNPASLSRMVRKELDRPERAKGFRPASESTRYSVLTRLKRGFIG